MVCRVFLSLFPRSLIICFYSNLFFFSYDTFFILQKFISIISIYFFFFFNLLLLFSKGKMVLVKNDLNATWAAMENLVDRGLVRKIGICNFTTQMIRQIKSKARIDPSILQIEIHLENSQSTLLRFAIENDLRVTAFSALGASSYVQLGMATTLDVITFNKVVKEIAVKHNKTEVQIAIRWAIQRKTLPLTKTTTTSRMIENRDVFDFYLDSSDMTALSSLNCNRRYNDPGVFTLGMGTFCPIYE